MCKESNSTDANSNMLGNYLHRIPINAVFPRPILRWPHAAERLPDRAVTLETTPESNLPDSVSTAHPSLCLNVGELVPNGARGSVAKAM